jgi:hypothetical protein
MLNPIVFQFILIIYMIAGFLLFNSPLLQAALFIFFRATFQIAAFKQFVVFGAPYFLPSVGLVALASIFAWFTHGPTSRLSVVFKIYLGFLYITAISAVLNIETEDSFADLAIKLICPVFIYLLVFYGIREENDIDRALLALMYSSFVPLCVGIVEFAMGGGYSYPLDAFVIGLRVTSTVIDANLYGIYLSICLFVTLALFLRIRTKATIFFLCFILFSIVTAKNRGTWISLFLALIPTVVVFRSRLRVLYWIGSAMGVALLSIPVLISRFSELGQQDEYGQSMDTASERLAFQQLLIEKNFESPLFGSGIGAAVKALSKGLGAVVLPHNDYLRIGVDSGDLALLVYCAFLIAQYIVTLQYRTSRHWQVQFAAHFAQVFLILVSFVQNVYADILVYSMLMYLMAVSHRAASFDQPNGT